MILKAGKSFDDVKPYCPIILLPITSKVMELVFTKEITTVVESKRLTSDHQFDFRKKHGTLELVHLFADIINTAFDEKSSAHAFFST